VTRSRAAVTIRTMRSSSGTYLTFQAARADVPDLRVTLDDDGVLREARADLDLALIALKNAILGVEVTDADAPEIYRLLRQIGLRQMFMIFSRPAVIRDLLGFWRSALPFALNPSPPPPHPSPPPPLVECVGELGAMLPIEYLPLSLEPPDAVRSRADLIRACRKIIGFSCVVRQSFVTLPVAQGSTLRPGTRGRLPVRFLHHDGLPGAELELAWFTGTASEHIEVVGPYPSGLDGGPSLSDQIHDPSLSLTGAPGRTPDGIQHFACHCYATSDKPLENEIELSGGGRTLRLTLGELITDIAGHFNRGRRPAEMPLVVMNACGASRISAASSLSFPWFFLKNDNRGFVGSDIEVPDDIAAEFSTAFYTHFILARMPLGRAFHVARNHLLAKFGNPLGISYSAYADPDLRVDLESLE